MIPYKHIKNKNPHMEISLILSQIPKNNKHNPKDNDIISQG